MEAMEVLKHAVYGCYLLMVSAGEEINGMPLSLFMQVSFRPPRVACGVSPARRTHALVREAGAFAVVFLRRDQAGLIERFKLKGETWRRKFEGLEWRRGVNGSPLLVDCLGYVECDLLSVWEPGDHSLFIGEVTAAEVVRPGKVLTLSELGKYYGGGG